jgi:hypothetical protein
MAQGGLIEKGPGKSAQERHSLPTSFALAQISFGFTLVDAQESRLYGIRLVADHLSWGNAMFRLAKNAAAALALTGLVFSQAAGATAPNRSASPSSRSGDLAGVGTMGALIALAVAVAVIVIVVDDNKNKHRPASP